jgi:hypothetical protein
VVETSLHSLSVKYGGSGKQSAREGPVYPFFQKIHDESSTSRRRPAHANSAFTDLATPPTGAMRS